jgi:hypothetical protein
MSALDRDIDMLTGPAVAELSPRNADAVQSASTSAAEGRATTASAASSSSSKHRHHHGHHRHASKKSSKSSSHTHTKPYTKEEPAEYQMITHTDDEVKEEEALLRMYLLAGLVVALSVRVVRCCDVPQLTRLSVGVRSVSCMLTPDRFASSSVASSLDTLTDVDQESFDEEVADLHARIPSLCEWAAQKIEEDTQSVPVCVCMCVCVCVYYVRIS